MSRKRRARRYAKAIVGADEATVRHEWLKFLAGNYREDGDPEIFKELRVRPRHNGAKIDLEFARGELSARDTFRLIRARCADVYVTGLNRYGIAVIDMESLEYKRLTKNLAFQVLQAFYGIDADDKTQVCTSMAKTWHQFVKELHQLYGLPTVARIQRNVIPESDAEDNVLRSGSFETILTPAQITYWENATA